MYISVGDTESLSEDRVIEKQLSDNVLALEITGPDVSNVSIVDFPGLMHSMFLVCPGFCQYHKDSLTNLANSSEYTHEDIDTVWQLASDYMQEPHTIVL